LRQKNKKLLLPLPLLLLSKSLLTQRPKLKKPRSNSRHAPVAAVMGHLSDKRQQAIAGVFY